MGTEPESERDAGVEAGGAAGAPREHRGMHQDKAGDGSEQGVCQEGRLQPLQFPPVFQQSNHHRITLLQNDNAQSDGILVVPLNTIDKWFDKFMKKYALDPNFVFKTDESS